MKKSKGPKKNYKIEGNINFFSELQKKVDIPLQDDKDKCKITYQPLQHNSIELSCKHKFNYLPLYEEILQQKKFFSSLETCRLKSSEIKCPFCRCITHKLLPFIPLTNVKRVYGVNHPKTYCMKSYECNYIYVRGKKKNMMCKKDAYQSVAGTFCTGHHNMMEKRKTLPSTSNVARCEAILRSGKRKGEKCGCKIRNDPTLLNAQNTTCCKRHTPKTEK